MAEPSNYGRGEEEDEDDEAVDDAVGLQNYIHFARIS